MPRDAIRHHLPPASIGYFSPSTGPERLRERRIYVLRKESDKPFVTKAEKVGFRRDLYGYRPQWDWDSYFKFGETFVHEPVNNLMADGPGNFRLRDWARLAWYITTLIVRAPELEIEMEKLGYLSQADSPAYAVDAQLTSSAVLRARWALEWSPEQDYILPDRGITGTYWNLWNSFAYHVPLRKNFSVVLGAGPYEKPVHWNGKEWLITLEYQRRDAPNADKLNALAWLAGRAECYGADPNQLQEAKSESQSVPEALHPVAQAYASGGLLGLSRQERRKDSITLLTLIDGGAPPLPGEPTIKVI
jgi:hypothetical protein